VLEITHFSTTRPQGQERYHMHSVGLYLNSQAGEFSTFCRDLTKGINSHFRKDELTGEWYDPRWPQKLFKVIDNFQSRKQAEQCQDALDMTFEYRSNLKKVTVKYNPNEENHE
jgi:hypothetical protein